MTAHATSQKSYFLVFAALVLLTLTTAGVKFLPLTPVVHNVVGLLIAAVKASLVVLFFMHLIQSSKLTRVVAVSGLLWLAIMMALTLSDYLTRAWLDVPGH